MHELLKLRSKRIYVAYSSRWYPEGGMTSLAKGHDLREVTCFGFIGKRRKIPASLADQEQFRPSVHQTRGRSDSWKCPVSLAGIPRNRLAGR